MSYATILIPGSGIIDSYATTPEELPNALGIYLIAWFMFTFMMLYVTVFHNFTLATTS
jgi:succinate-acetate transporter protein